MVWIVEKKVFYHILDFGFESVTVPIRVKFEFEVRDRAFVPESLSVDHLFNKEALLKRYPNLKSVRLEQIIFESVNRQISNYLLKNGYINENTGTDEIL